MRRSRPTDLLLLACACVAACLMGPRAFAAGLFVSSHDSHRVYLLDSDTGAVLRTYEDPLLVSPTGLALSPDRATLYVGNNNSATDVLLFDVATGARTGSFSSSRVSFAQGLALDNAGQRLYVGSDLIESFSTDTGAPGAGIDVSTPGDFQLTRDGSAVYAATSRDRVVRALTDSGGTDRTYTFPSGSGPTGVALSPDESLLYVAFYFGTPTSRNMIAVVDTASGSTVGTFNIPGPLGNLVDVDVTPDGSTLFVSDTFNNALYRVDAATGAVSPLLTSAPLDGPGYLLYAEVPEPTVALAGAALSAAVLALRRRGPTLR